MPFNVTHNAIHANEGAAGIGPSKEEQSNIYEDKVAVRTRLSFARFTRQNHVEHLKTIEACGCDTPYNKPYRPLGSMDSVLNLRIKKTKAYQKPVSLKGHRRLANAAAHLRSLVASPESNSEGDDGASEKASEELAEQDDRSLASKMAFLRESTRGGESSSTLLVTLLKAYSVIQRAVCAANERLRRIKGGTAFSTVVKTHGPLEGALWASISEGEGSTLDWLDKSVRTRERHSRQNTRLSLELPEDLHQTRFASVATLKQELEKLESSWLPKPRRCSKTEEGSRRKRSSLVEVHQEGNSHRLNAERQQNSCKERKSLVKATSVHEKGKRKDTRVPVPAYMYYSSTNKAKLKERIDDIRKEVQPKSSPDQTSAEGSVAQLGRNREQEQDGHERIEVRTRAMANKMYSASKQILELRSNSASKLTKRINQNQFERPLHARCKFQACRTDLAAQTKNGQPNCFGASSDIGLERLRARAKQLYETECTDNLRAQPWFEGLLQYIRESFGDVLPVQEKLLRALRQIVVEGYRLDTALFQGLLLQGFSKVELRSPELQHVLAYVRDKVIEMPREEYRDFLATHKLPIPNDLVEQVSVSKPSGGESSERARFQVGASMKAAAAIAKFKNRYKKRRKDDHKSQQERIDHIPSGLDKSDMLE